MKGERDLFEELGNYDSDCKMDIAIIERRNVFSEGLGEYFTENHTIYSGRMDKFRRSELEREIMSRKVACVECCDGVLKIYLKGWEYQW